MASGKIKGITVEIGGDTTKLGKAIGDIEKQSNSLKGELKQVEKLLKMDPGNADLIAQKQEILTKAVAETTEKLNILKETQSQVEAQFKDGKIGEDQYRAFQREIIKTEGELKNFQKTLDDTGEDFEEMGDSAEESSDGFTIMGGALADLVSNAIQGAISAIGDFIGSILELSEATEEYRQMQAKLSGASETFGYSIEFANEKYKEFYKYLGDDQASTNAITNLMGIGAETDTVSKLAEGATAVWASYGDSIPIEGLTEAINETITVGKVTGGMADTINWAKDANEGLSKALSGNKEAQKAYNDAIKEGLPVEDAFNEALAKITDSQERADVVAKFLNETYGESKQKYDEMSGSILDANEAELKLKDTQAQLGQAVEPVNTALTNMKNQALETITPLVEKLVDGFMNLYDWLQKHPAVVDALTAVIVALTTAITVLAGVLAIEGIINGVAKAWAFLNTTMLANPITLIVSLLAGLVTAFITLWNTNEEFRQFWIDLWENIKEVASTVIDALVEFFTVKLPEAWENFKTKTSEVIDAVVTFFSELPGKIWDAIVTAIDKVNEWTDTIRTTVTEGVQNLISSAISYLKELPSKIWEAIKGAIDKVSTWGNNMKEKATTAVKNMVDNVVSKAKEIPNKVYDAIKGAVSKVTSWGSDMLSKAKSGMTKVVDGISTELKKAISKVKTIGGDIVKGIWNGINDKVGWIKNQLMKFKDAVIKALKKAFGIASPSKLMRDQIGKFISEGIAVGVTENEDKPIGALDQLANDMANKDFDFNGATITRKLVNTFGSASADAVNSNDLMGKLDGIYERLGRLQIVLDSGTLIGETIDKIDSALGNNYSLRARGV